MSLVNNNNNSKHVHGTRRLDTKELNTDCINTLLPFEDLKPRAGTGGSFQRSSITGETTNNRITNRGKSLILSLRKKIIGRKYKIILKQAKMPKSFLLRRHLRQEWNSREDAYPLAGPLQFSPWDQLSPESEFLKLSFQRKNLTFEGTSETNEKQLEKGRLKAEYFGRQHDYTSDLAPNQSYNDNGFNASRRKDISSVADAEYAVSVAKDKKQSGKISKRSQHRSLEVPKNQREGSKKLPAACQTGGTKQPYKCDQCGKIFKTKYTLTIHLKMPSHTGAKPFVCAICGKGFRLSSTLCRHKIIHTSEKPHKCHICDKAFNRSSTLKTHIRTHSELKEFICDICGKGFHQKGNLRNHVLIHTGEKPYRCNLCEKAFNKLSNLKFHMHIHTDNAPYRCRYCKTCFTRRCDLKLHIADCNHQC